MKFSCNRKTALLLFLSTGATATFAQERPNDEQNSIENIEVTGSRLSNSSSNHVIALDKIEYQSLDSILNSLPSIQVNPTSGAGGLNEIYVRGADPNYTLIFFNGIPLNDSTNSRGGVADISNISSFLVDKIDVATGSRSAVYGSQAIAGVVNFNSELKTSADEGANYKIRLAADTESGFELGASAELDTLSFKVVKKRSPKLYEGSALDSDSALLVAQPEVPKGELKLSLWANNAQAESFPDDSGGALFAESKNLESRHIQNRAISANYLLPQIIDNNLSNHLVISAYALRKAEGIDTPAVAPGLRDPQGFPASINSNVLRKSNVTAYFEQQHQDFQFLLGADYTHEKGESGGQLDFGFFNLPTDFIQSRETLGFFAEVDYAISKQLNWHLAGRFDHNSNSAGITQDKDVFTPSTSLLWQLAEHHQLSVHWGKGFKLPSFYALSHPLIGNPDLLNEKSETTQVKYRYFHSAGEFSLELFDYEFENLIDFEAGPPPRLVNRNEAKTDGWEALFVSKESADSWQWHVSYTYLEAKSDGNQTMLGRAKNQASLGVQKRLPSRHLTLGIEVDYRSGVFASSIPTGRVELSNAIDLSVDLAWKVSQTVNLQAGISNLLNEELEFTPGNVHKGSYAWASLDFSF